MDLPAIKIMEQYAREHPEVISLSQGIPASASDPRIRLSVMSALLSNKVDKYSEPQGMLEFREKISDQLMGDGMKYSSSEVIVTVGAIEAMTVSLMALLKPGDEVIIPTPTYSAFFRSAKVAGLNVTEFPLNEEGPWSLDISLLEDQISKRTKAILLCHPNNPTGSTLTQEKFESLGQLAIEHNLIIFLDEVYRNMFYGEAALYNPCTNSAFKNYIVRIVSFSKDFSLTGWRVGFLHSSQQIIDEILPVHDTVVNCAPVISQYAALSALENAESIFLSNKELYHKNRQLMGERLLQLSDYLSFTWPQGSYFFFPKFKKMTDSRSFCLDLVKKAGIAAVPGSDFGTGGEGHIRLCFGREKESITEGMNRLENYFKENL
jgi:aminotransferase